MKQVVSLFMSALLFCCWSCQQADTLFVAQQNTAITFNNIITENDTFNILAYEYVYNGGGVAFADFDGNGWQDVFFTGNMVENELYLNHANFQFENISELAGITDANRWNSGVAITDINYDGLPDIYVCATTYEPAARRANQLYVHQGNNEAGIPQFKEMARAYGLADTSHTTNAAFFDYDNDGDLDVYLLVNEMDKTKQPNRYRKKITDGSSARTDKLLRNDFNTELGHPVFTDISAEAGILIEGFGLGLNICDLNQDGWKDIYVANDYLTNDLLWMNNGDGTFTDKASDYLKHTSHSAMGCDVVDLNNDGRADIMTVDMMPEDNYRRKTMLLPNNYSLYLNNNRYGYDYQYVRNTLQLNLGTRPDNNDLVFSEQAMLAGVSGTDWSWTPLIADFDQNGYRDMIITNGFPRDITDRDFMDYHLDKKRFVAQEKLLQDIPSVQLKNYAYRNKGVVGQAVQFENVTANWGITEATFSNGAAYADLDNDGDLDYIVNNINSPASVFKNTINEQGNEQQHWLQIKLAGTAKNAMGLGTFIRIEYGDGQQQVWEHTIYRGYLSSMQNMVQFGLGKCKVVDKLTIDWPDGKQQIIKDVTANQVLNLSHAAAKYPKIQKSKNRITNFQELSDTLGLNFKHTEIDHIDFNVQPLLLHKLSQYGPSLAVGDVNGDRLDDLYIGGSRFKKGIFYVQNTAGTFQQADILEGPKGKNKREEELASLLFDADMDGDLDLYLVSGSYEFALSDTAYQDRLFLNEDGQFKLAKDALPTFLSSGSCVKASDFDRDGDLDLFVGGRVLPNEYPKPVSSYLLRNDSEAGQVQFTIVNEQLAPQLNNLGLVCDVLWTDFDQDGWQDLLIAGEWMPLTFLRNEAGKFTRIENNIGTKIGWWNSLAAADFDLDGDIDYIAGNQGQNNLYQANGTSAVAIYAKDFDGNGGFDAIPSTYFLDQAGVLQEFPFFNRLDIQKQVLPVRGYYPYHKVFGTARMEDILTRFDTEGMLHLAANYLQTSYIENLGNGAFDIRPLPIETQVAPIYGILARDFNGDALPDLLLTGNDHGTEVSMGNADAFNGLLLAGDGQGNFMPVAMQESGICIPADGKSLVQLELANGQTLILAGQNKAELLAFQTTANTGKCLTLQPNDAWAIISLKDGRTYREELTYGHSFLSQSSRKLWLPSNTTQVEIFGFQGKQRTEAL